DHGLAQALRRDEDEVAAALEKLEPQGGLDALAIDARGPGPVEVGHRLEAAEPGARQAALETPASAVLALDGGDMREGLGRAPGLLGGEGDEVVELGRGGA